ncbi:MAG: hypothetical protein ABIO63_02705 [Casimicrobiaceae bacterium]
MSIVKQEVHYNDGSVITVYPNSVPVIVEILGDEFLPEMHYTSRTNPERAPNGNSWPLFRHPCTPSVVRFYKDMIDDQGDFRVNISQMLPSYLRLNHEDKITDPKTRYFFGKITALFNNTGYPRQMYTTMQGNKLRGFYIGEWFMFETLKPTSNVIGMSYQSHPWLIHRFDLVCSKRVDGVWKTYHKPFTPQGVIDYFLVTVEGIGYIPARYIVPA